MLKKSKLVKKRKKNKIDTPVPGLNYYPLFQFPSASSVPSTLLPAHILLILSSSSSVLQGLLLFVAAADGQQSSEKLISSQEMAQEMDRNDVIHSVVVSLNEMISSAFSHRLLSRSQMFDRSDKTSYRHRVDSVTHL